MILKKCLKQISYADLAKYFKKVYSIEAIKSFDPQKVTYEYILKQQQIDPKEVLMMAAQKWDIYGAHAFVRRPGQIIIR